MWVSAFTGQSRFPWCHFGVRAFQENVTPFKARECGHVGGDISLFYSLGLWECCSPLRQVKTNGLGIRRSHLLHAMHINGGYFLDPMSGNLALTPAATKAIDKGVSLPEVAEDIRRRPRSGQPDIGAWEFNRL